MDLRRCPACGNMVAREAICPICGWSYGAAVARRVVRWTLLVALLALLAWRLLVSNSDSSDAEGPRVLPPATQSR